METNEYQIGGNHYAGDYQHWDFVMANSLNYLLGCATKYVIRHKKRNGTVDLRKAVHYIAKTQDLCVYHYKFEEHTKLMLLNKQYASFFNSIDGPEQKIITKILQNNLAGAQYLLGTMISSMELKAIRGYVNQD